MRNCSPETRTRPHKAVVNGDAQTPRKAAADRRGGGTPLVSLLAFSIGIALGLTGCTSIGRLSWDRPNPRAVEEVRAGKRATASAAWWGFSGEDDTAALQAAIRSGARRVIIPNLGRPWVVEPIQLASHQEIVFEKGVVVAAREGKFLGTSDSLFTASDKEHIILRGQGASCIMRKQDYRKAPYPKGEWRMGLALRGCRNVEVSGLRLTASGGDGIYVGRTEKNAGCTDIRIRDVVCDDNYRQGISIISVRGLRVERCVLRGTEGTAPAAGIDFEPNRADEFLVDCVVRNCVIESNAAYGLLFVPRPLTERSEPVSIRVENCRVRDNRAGALRVLNSRVSGCIELHGNELSGKRNISKDIPNLKLWIRKERGTP